MPNQLSLIYAETQRKTAAIQATSDAAGDLFLDAAYRAAVALLARRNWITSLDVWALLAKRGITTEHPQAMSAVMMRLSRERLAYNTGVQIDPETPRPHRRSVTVWARMSVPVTDVVADLQKAGEL
jgi:hypothetical protein